MSMPSLPSPVASTASRIVFELRTDCGSAHAELTRLIKSNGAKGTATLFDVNPSIIYRLCRKLGIQTTKAPRQKLKVCRETYNSRISRGWEPRLAAATPALERSEICRRAAFARWDAEALTARGSSRQVTNAGTKVPFFERVSHAGDEVTI